MKKYLLIAVLASTALTASAQSKWNIGLGTAAVTNISKFESGNEEANALFSSNPVPPHNLAV
jgi:hypothetical protein